MQGFKAVFKRELFSYFKSPIAYIFVVLFILLNGVFTFYIGNFLDRGNADLAPFFSFHPFLYLFFIPALSMRLWAEERKSGTIELLFTLPIPPIQIILGKFFAAWFFAFISLVFTFPIWLTVSFLGEPDHGVIISGYISSLCVAGTFLAIGSCMSALTSSQVIAFILSAACCFLFLMTGLPMVLDFISSWTPMWFTNTIANISVISHFEAMSKGLITLKSIIFFISLIFAWLTSTSIVLNLVRGR